VFAYLAVYTLLAVGSFAVVTVIGGEGDANHGLDAFRGMGRHRPLLAGAFTVLLLGQAGIPFTGGFVVKLGVLAAAVDNGSYLLAAVAMLAAAVAAFVYLRILVALYLEDDGSDGDGRAALPAAPAGPVFVSLVAAAGVLAVGLVPGPLLSLARDAVPVLVGG
jgi:NADH-quinone oxidoreductase subunit N